MTDHRSELRHELLVAAQRRNRMAVEIARRRTTRRRRVPVAACLLLALGLVLVAAVVRDAPPASADMFKVTVQGQDLVIEVVGRVESPAAARAELGAVGVQAEVVPIPAAPSLVGQIVSAFIDFGDMDSETDGGRTTTIRIPADAPGTLTIRYGRAAKRGELYEATESAPDCGTYSGRLVTDGLRRTIGNTYGPTVRWQEVSGGNPSSIEGDEVSPAAEIIDVLPTAQDVVLVIVTDGVSDPPPGMSCT